MRRFGTLALAIIVAATIASPAWAADDDDFEDLNDFIQQRPGGWYLKGAVMAVDQESTDISSPTLGSYKISFDTGWGGSVGGGYSFDNTPLSLEIEYTYRTAQVSTVQVQGGGNVGFGSTTRSHTLMFNGVLDFDLGFTAFGFYLGGGIGAAYTEGELNLAPGVQVSDDDTQFAYQFFGGIKYNIDEHWMVFAGARWFDSASLDLGSFSGVNNRSINYEIGLRFYF